MLVFSSKVFDLSFSSPRHTESSPLSTQISIEKFNKNKKAVKPQKAITKKQSVVKKQREIPKSLTTSKERSASTQKSSSEAQSKAENSSTFVADFSSTSTKAPKELQKFFRSLISEIHNKKNYPRLSKKLRESGTVHIKFMVDSSGEVKDAALIKSSKYQRLNNSALKVVSQLEIKEPLPSNYDKIVVTFPMNYIL